jgi:hypothetical protein
VRRTAGALGALQSLSFLASLVALAVVGGAALLTQQPGGPGTLDSRAGGSRVTVRGIPPQQAQPGQGPIGGVGSLAGPVVPPFGGVAAPAPAGGQAPQGQQPGVRLGAGGRGDQRGDVGDGRPGGEGTGRSPLGPEKVGPGEKPGHGKGQPSRRGPKNENAFRAIRHRARVAEEHAAAADSQRHGPKAGRGWKKAEAQGPMGGGSGGGHGRGPGPGGRGAGDDGPGGRGAGGPQEGNGPPGHGGWNGGHANGASSHGPGGPSHPSGGSQGHGGGSNPGKGHSKGGPGKAKGKGKGKG